MAKKPSNGGNPRSKDFSAMGNQREKWKIYLSKHLLWNNQQKKNLLHVQDRGGGWMKTWGRERGKPEGKPVLEWGKLGGREDLCLREDFLFRRVRSRCKRADEVRERGKIPEGPGWGR